MSNQCGCNHWTKPVCPEISCSWNEWKAQQNLAARKAQRKPMTDEEIDSIGRRVLGAGYGGNTDRDLARAIEAAHGIKENT